MEETINGLTTINVELTSRCNKNCWMCGRRKVEKDYPELTLQYGDMDFNILKSIAPQIPPGIVIQFHKDGEGLLYHRFGEAIRLFQNQIKCLTTNGKLLVEKAEEIIGGLDTISLSIIQDDPEADEQYDIIRRFLDIKKSRKPFVVYRLLGNIEPKRYEKLPGVIVKRILHSPMGSFEYTKKVTIPEIGICLDLLNHLVINNTGEVSFCVRFDPKKIGVLGNINERSLKDLWNGEERKLIIQQHIKGNRSLVPLCSACDFWGVPTSP